jgi:actin, other eukaryote
MHMWPFEREWLVPNLDRTLNSETRGSITFGNARFRCTEVLFDPSLIGISSPGIHNLVVDSIMECDQNIRKDLLGDIWLTGAGSKLVGLQGRLQHELSTLGTAEFGELFPWLGGSILGALDSFIPSFISNDDYNEFGQILSQECADYNMSDYHKCLTEPVTTIKN